jgi:hypothetical protein
MKMALYDSKNVKFMIKFMEIENHGHVSIGNN